MILIMAGLGSALIATIVILLEWRALVGYWRLKRRPPRKYLNRCKVKAASVGGLFLGRVLINPRCPHIRQQRRTSRHFTKVR
jgi:hypothetical protein